MKLVYGSDFGTDGLEFFPTYEDELSEVFRSCGELGRRVGQLGHAIISVENVVGWWGVRVGYVDHKALKVISRYVPHSVWLRPLTVFRQVVPVTTS